MLHVTGLKDTTPYTERCQWLKDYLEICGANRFPQSFHLLNGLWALSTFMGRAVFAQRSTYRLYPPISIMLLGTSGVGKSQTLRLATRVLKNAATVEQWETDVGAFDLLPGFSISQGGFTIRGLMQEWQRVAAGGATMGATALEGTHIENEMANVVTPRKGNEAVTTWMIQALEHQDIVDYTGMYGRQELKNCTVSFAFCSTLEYIRKALSADEFAGGFMHRFLIAYETDPDFNVKEKIPNYRELGDLSTKLQTIRNNLPETLTVDQRATSRLDALQRQPRFYGNSKLAGFYNRVDGLVLKLAMNFTLGDGRGTVELADVEAARQLLLARFAPPLEGVLDQLDASPEKKQLFEISDSLLSSGPDGWTISEFQAKLGRGSSKKMRESLDSLCDMHLAFLSDDKEMLFGKQEWKREYDNGPNHEMGW